MEQFRTALNLQPMNIWLRFTPTQAKGDPPPPRSHGSTSLCWWPLSQGALGTGNAFLPGGLVSPFTPGLPGSSGRWGCRTPEVGSPQQAALGLGSATVDL